MSLAKLSLMNRLVIARSWLAPVVCHMKDLLGLPIFAPLAGMPMDLYRDYWKHTWASVSRSLFNTLLTPDVAGLFEGVDRSLAASGECPGDRFVRPGQASASAAFTRSGVIGTRRMRTPVASKIALAMAAAPCASRARPRLRREDPAG